MRGLRDQPLSVRACLPISAIAWAAGNRIPLELTVGEHDSERVRLGNRRLQTLLLAQNSQCLLHEQAAHTHFDTHTMLRNNAHPWYAILRRHAFS